MYSREDMYVAWEEGYLAGWRAGGRDKPPTDKNPYERKGR